MDETADCERVVPLLIGSSSSAFPRVSLFSDACRLHESEVEMAEGELLHAELLLEATTLLFADVVESMRLTATVDFEGALRVRELIGRTVACISGAFEGELLERRGDGVLAKFPDARKAAACALAIHRITQEHNVRYPGVDAALFRIGIHGADVLTDREAVYGVGVSIAARLTALADAGGTVLSDSVRDQLTFALDGQLEDLGEQRLKHVDQAVRVYRLTPKTQRLTSAAIPDRDREADLPGKLAIVPPLADFEGDELPYLGQVLADELIAIFSRSTDFRVCSRLTTRSLARRDMPLATVVEVTGADIVLSGRYRTYSGEVVASFELVDAQRGDVLWADSFRWRREVAEQLQPDWLEHLAQEIRRALLAVSASAVESARMPTLKSHALLIGGIGLMHRGHRESFTRARAVFEHLQERHPRAAKPYAWLATWRVFNVFQGWFDNRQQEIASAHFEASKALDLSAADPVALTTYAMVQGHLRGDHSTAERTFSDALAINRSEAMAWLHRGTLLAFQGRGDQAEADIERAVQLSPIDPWRYYFDTLHATAALAKGDFCAAIERAKSSLFANRSHASTWRVLAIAHAEIDDMPAARMYAEGVLRLDPGLTGRSYLERSPAAPYETGKRWARALVRAGIPA